jgi:predicted transcriptional regulator
MNWNKEKNASLLEIIGLSMKGKRLSREISQAELAKNSGVSLASIARLETGKGNISLSNLLLIMKALEMADELKIIFKDLEFSPSLLAKASTKKTRERVRKSYKEKKSKSSSWKWGDEK